MRQYAKIAIVAYDDQWPVSYQNVKAQIAAALGDRLLSVEHIGSTAVPSLGAKPIIDMLGAVRDFPGSIPGIVALLAAADFEYVDKGRPDRHFFRRGGWGHGTHHLHIVEFEGDDWRRQIFFRDWLRAHPEVAREYGELKVRLAEQMDRDRPAYKSAKTDFIKAVLEKMPSH